MQLKLCNFGIHCMTRLKDMKYASSKKGARKYMARPEGCLNLAFICANYSDLLPPVGRPKWWSSKGIPPGPGHIIVIGAQGIPPKFLIQDLRNDKKICPDSFFPQASYREQQEERCSLAQFFPGPSTTRLFRWHFFKAK